MKKINLSIISLSLIYLLILPGVANAYWIWTPETKKFVNPKYAVKDSPKEQYDWAMSFYDSKDFQRAATEFEKLAKQYELSEYASKAQYYVGLCYENMNKYYLAFQNYQKAIDNFPHIANTEEILAREFAIGNLYLSKPGPKVLGTDIMAPLDRAVEIFRKVVENAPYGKHAEEAQFKLGEALKKSERYEEAVQAFHKLVEDYPDSKLIAKAMYEESDCAYKASLKPAYDASATDSAIKTFEKFTSKNKDADLAKNATTTMKRLKDNVSEKSYRAAEFYESQGKLQAAIIYYQDVIDSYPESSFVNQSKAKIEAIKVRMNKKPAASIDLTKKKSDSIKQKAPKKPWKPFSFKSEKKVQETVKEPPKKKSLWKPFSLGVKKEREPAARSEPKKKSSWNLFNLGAKKEPAARETPAKKEWRPLSFETKRSEEPKPAPEIPMTDAPAAGPDVTAPAAVEKPAPEPAAVMAEVPAEIETPKAEPPLAQAAGTSGQPRKARSWNPFYFVSGKPSPAKDAAKKKEWKPFNFKTKKSENGAEEKQWKPLNFDTNKEVAAKEAPVKREWKPLYFGTNDAPMGVKK